MTGMHDMTRTACDRFSNLNLLLLSRAMRIFRPVSSATLDVPPSPSIMSSCIHLEGALGYLTHGLWESACSLQSRMYNCVIEYKNMASLTPHTRRFYLMLTTYRRGLQIIINRHCETRGSQSPKGLSPAPLLQRVVEGLSFDQSS